MAGRPIIPREVPSTITQVKGCSCGGMTLHTLNCTIHDLKPEEAIQNIERAEERILAYTEGLNTGRRLAEMERDRIDANVRGRW